MENALCIGLKFLKIKRILRKTVVKLQTQEVDAKKLSDKLILKESPMPHLRHLHFSKQVP